MFTLTFPFSWVSLAWAGSKVAVGPVTRDPVAVTGESNARVTFVDLCELLFTPPQDFSRVVRVVDEAIEAANDPRGVDD